MPDIDIVPFCHVPIGTCTQIDPPTRSEVSLNRGGAGGGRAIEKGALQVHHPVPFECKVVASFTDSTKLHHPKSDFI